MSDMQTMPIRELIDEIRIKVKKLPMVQMLVINVLVRRLEEQANMIDNLTEQLHDAIDSNPDNYKPAPKHIEYPGIEDET